ncbi:TPA: IucA/IucC family siderophore biosynthesis protein [Xanthomonas vasicola pv. zeae]|uniref:IucA/IucC family siderophore biosynthesis protein n=4 Tax=Xanthomonas vasicola TaxID=56459 RepID=A0AAE8JXJ4_XANVA|nr:IucA/IucC family siderophore biosynthesis protein [Xanthomonas vasicola]AVQ07940.1 IucA/IucC family siderophore biosynthesis protein [Xanthomonas vasicola pv. vasculorum]AZM72139.1 IucA/IucC family siderophore biosynthesis protein [Xanthomonas vasicola pv. vasculorum]KFA32250.1 siderophore biosynthesis protein, IucA/IucC family [Xanthomonas vasicola pv. vasculorum NCPPB 1326]KFA34092.1 siderophore biosynthesis protein, IucA/IucC family [Xanthomonas vasicola pv. vasculorum NCPPB 1381]MBV6747
MSSVADQRYIATRIIDACLREDLRGIVSRGSAAIPDAGLLAQWNDPSPVEGWWRIAHLPGGTVWLPIHRQGALQDIGARGDSWIVQGSDCVHVEHGAQAWLQRMSAELDAETQQLHRAYAEEAACAAAHRGLARQAYQAQVPALSNALQHPDAAERAYRCDQLASYRDHPFYPTARAKAGLDAAELRHYAPEFAPTFTLRWLAIPQALAQCTSAPPAELWPSCESLGLPPELAATHVAWPVHPLVWERLEQDGLALPEGVLRAPNAWLDVRPTLSVRTLVPLQHPQLHLKLPIPMRTLGALNLRLIKPSTLYDGYWLERALRRIDALDPALQGRCVFVDESHGGHIGQTRHLAYLVRRYPAKDDATLVPVAALCAPMPDGRPMAIHLAERFAQGDVLHWWRNYTELLLAVHLRLWLRYGIALEANQQNSVLVYADGQPTRLLMKDNDAARIAMPQLRAALPDVDALGPLQDERIAVDDPLALAQMFCTIVLQLDLQAVLEGLAEWQPALRTPLYAQLQAQFAATLAQLDADDIDTSPARRLLAVPRLPVKYLLSAGSLLSKQLTGATDINKFYGDSAPNPFGAAFVDAQHLPRKQAGAQR